MLKIRLARVGKKKHPMYRFVVSEAGRDLYGKALEILGHYNPFTKVIEVKKDRILYWISVGAQPSPTAHNLLVDQNVISGEKVKASKAGKKPAQAEDSPAASGAVQTSEEKSADSEVTKTEAEAPAKDAPATEEPKSEKPDEVPSAEKEVSEVTEEQKPITPETEEKKA